MFRSSTSSSDSRRRRWPVAGLIAVALVIALDGMVFRVFPPWKELKRVVDDPYYRTTIADRRAIAALEYPREGRRTAVLMGSSRMQRAWMPKMIEPRPPESLVVKSLAHARIFPPEMRAAAEAMRDRAPDVVVFGISEMDTHVPLMLDRRTSFPASHLYTEAAFELGPRWLFEERLGWLRSVVAEILAAYRHRDLLGEAGLDRLRRFPKDRRRKPPRPLDPVGEEILADFLDRATDPRLQKWHRSKTREQIRRMEHVTAGSHVAVHERYLRGATEILRAAGSEVVILELPIHPAAARLYDTGLRAEFLAISARLERDFGARVIRLEDQQAFDENDFGDLTHVGVSGGRRISRTIVEAVLATDP